MIQSGILIPSCALAFSIVLIFIYYSKAHIKSFETKLYELLIVSNFFGLVLEILCCSVVFMYDELSFVSMFILKLYLVYLVTYITIFTVYVIFISFSKNKEKELITNKKLNFGYNIFYIISIILIVFLDLNIYNNGIVGYTYGPASDFIYTISAICIIVWFVCLTINFKNIKTKKYIPLYLFISIGGILAFVQRVNPSLFLITSMETLVVFLMYFTIENPDLKVIEELNDNKKLIEKTNEDKLNLLFELSQEVKQPIESIESLSDEALAVNNLSVIKEKLKIIKANSKQLSLISNNILNISTMDLSNIKISNVVYKPDTLFKELKKRTIEKLGDKKVEFRYSYASPTPDKLYGDPVKLKQIFTSFLNNAVEVTNNGFIELKINSIVKYDICRLIVTITDSGTGMDIDKVNEILGSTTLSEEDFEILDKVDVGTTMAHKIIKILNGTLIVKSEVGKGSEFLIIIDQKIKSDKDNISNDDYNRKNKILVVNDKSNELKKIEQKLLDMNYDVTTTLYGKDAIEKIKNKETFDVIIIDDEMNLKSAFDTLCELKKIKKFNTPVIITLEDNKKFLKEKYLEDGFTDYVLKENLDEEIKKVAKYI